MSLIPEIREQPDVPAQLFRHHLTRAKGNDTESPRGLDKVTRTL